MQLDDGLCILLYCPIESHRIFLTSNCIVMTCSVPVNCHVVICLPFMPCCLSKENTSSELWTPVQSLPLIYLPLLLLLVANHYYLSHHIVNPLLQQIGEIDNLTVRWSKVLSLCCAGLQVASNTFESFPSSYWFDNLGFLLSENLLLCSSHLALGVSQRGVNNTPTSFSGRGALQSLSASWR